MKGRGETRDARPATMLVFFCMLAPRALPFVSHLSSPTNHLVDNLHGRPYYQLTACGGPVKVSFTDRELDVMDVLWTHGPATVAEVRGHLGDPLAYTTVLTVLRTLEEKGHVGHREEGKAHRYFARVAQHTARRSALSRMVDRVFDGSAELLLTQLVADRGLSRDELKRLRTLMDERLERRKP